MTKTTLTLYGLPTAIRYHVHEPGRIEWHLDHDSEEMSHQELMLLEHLLRKHENQNILDMLWDEHQALVYEQDARAAAAAEDYNPF
jgi:hypothetical protein